MKREVGKEVSKEKCNAKGRKIDFSNFVGKLQSRKVNCRVEKVNYLAKVPFLFEI